MENKKIDLKINTRHNRKTILRFFDEVCNQRNTDIIKDIFAEEVNFNGLQDSHEKVKRDLTQIWDSFSKIRVKVDKASQMAVDDMVSTRRTWSGILSTDFRGMSPSDKEVEWSEISIVRFKNGKVVDDWIIQSPMVEKPDPVKKSGIRKLNSVAITIVVLLMLGILIYIFFPTIYQDRYALRLEFVKLLIQLLLIGVLGSILVQEFSRGRQRIMKKNEFRKTLFENMTRAYFKAKKVRRIWKAGYNKEEPDKFGISYSLIENQMKDLIDAQLELEFINRQVNVFSNVFKNRDVRIILCDETKHLESYLNDIIDKYEKLSPSNGTINISVTKEFNEFIIDTEKFKKNFSVHLRNSLDELQKEILDV